MSTERTPAALAVVIVGGFFAVLAVVIYRGPEPSPEIVAAMIGALVGAVGGPIGYYYGTSRQSARKDETIHALSAGGDGAPTAGPAGTASDPLVVTAPNAAPLPVTLDTDDGRTPLARARTERP